MRKFIGSVLLISALTGCADIVPVQGGDAAPASDVVTNGDASADAVVNGDAATNAEGSVRLPDGAVTSGCPDLVPYATAQGCTSMGGVICVGGEYVCMDSVRPDAGPEASAPTTDACPPDADAASSPVDAGLCGEIPTGLCGACSVPHCTASGLWECQSTRQTEICDGLDNDCDGTVDNNVAIPRELLNGCNGGRTLPLCQHRTSDGSPYWYCPSGDAAVVGPDSSTDASADVAPADVVVADAADTGCGPGCSAPDASSDVVMMAGWTFRMIHQWLPGSDGYNNTTWMRLMRDDLVGGNWGPVILTEGTSMYPNQLHDNGGGTHTGSSTLYYRSYQLQWHANTGTFSGSGTYSTVNDIGTACDALPGQSLILIAVAPGGSREVMSTMTAALRVPSGCRVTFAFPPGSGVPAPI